ncbi:Rad52/Rad22 family DNA repair protein, partial [Sphingobium olei]
MNMYDKLSRPFDPSQVSWRAQSLKSDGTAAMALCYIDARDVMRRLDEVCGPNGWSDSYTETGKGRL